VDGDDPARACDQAVPFAVGDYITGAYWFTSSTSFANPAITIGRMFSDTFAGISPGSAPFFVIFQLVGAAVAVVALAITVAVLGPALTVFPLNDLRLVVGALLWILAGGHVAIEEALEELNERERAVVRLRFGLDDGHPRTLEEVGREFGIAIIMSSHMLGEIERVCDHLVQIESGRLVRSAPITALTDRRQVLAIEVDGPAEPLAARLRQLGLEVRQDGRLLLVELKDESLYDAVRDAVVDLGMGLVRLEQKRHSLEELFQSPAPEQAVAGV